MKGISIEEAGVQDAVLIADLSRRTFVDTFADQNTPANMEKFLNEQFSSDQLIAEALHLDAVVDDRVENCLDVALESKAKPLLIWPNQMKPLPGTTKLQRLWQAFAAGEHK